MNGTLRLGVTGKVKLGQVTKPRKKLQTAYSLPDHDQGPQHEKEEEARMMGMGNPKVWVLPVWGS